MPLYRQRTSTGNGVEIVSLLVKEYNSLRVIIQILRFNKPVSVYTKNVHRMHCRVYGEEMREECHS